MSGNFFFKDNEYNSGYGKGFTGLGFYLKPSIDYYLGQNSKISVGAFMELFSGRDEFNQVIPNVRFQQRVNENFDIILGSIYGNTGHNLEEPLYRYDNFYIRNIEYGMQFWFHSDWWESDLWVDWQQFIFENDPFPERVVGGWTNDLRLGDGKIKIYIPFQVLVNHYGGEINDTDEPYYSIFNGDIGLSFRKEMWNGITSLETLYFWYNQEDITQGSDLIFPTNHGYGIYTKIKYEGPRGSARLGYWFGNDFYAPMGEPSFMNFSGSEEDNFIENRNLITLQGIWKHNFGDYVEMGARMDTYFDVESRKTNFAFGLFLNFKSDFLIANVPMKSQI